MAKGDVFQPSVRKREPAHRGPLSSKDVGAFQDEVIADMSRAARVLNDLESRYALKILELEEERQKNRALSEMYKSEKKLAAYRDAVAGSTITYFQTFRDLEGLLYTGVATANRLWIEPTFGTCHIPFTKVVSRFSSKNPATDDLFLPDTLSIIATAVDEGDGDVKAGTPELAIDGLGAEPWIRKVLFDLADSQNEVIMDVDIAVPSLFANDANLLQLTPAPAGEVDIINVTYSTTAADPTTPLPGFSKVEGVSSYQLHFAPLGITKLRIRLRQRHFTFEEAEKVFIYGLKEVGLYLCEVDRTAGQSTIQDNDIAIFKVDAPTGYKFNQIKGFVSNPTFATGMADDKIYFRIYGDEALTSQEFDSFTDPTPTSGSPLDISASNLSSIYVVVHLEYDTADAVSPVLNNFYINYTVV